MMALALPSRSVETVKALSVTIWSPWRVVAAEPVSSKSRVATAPAVTAIVAAAASYPV